MGVLVRESIMRPITWARALKEKRDATNTPIAMNEFFICKLLIINKEGMLAKGDSDAMLCHLPCAGITLIRFNGYFSAVQP
jgi:hypothetical protein